MKAHITETFERYENGKLMERRVRVREEGDGVESLFKGMPTPPSSEQLMRPWDEYLERLRQWLKWSRNDPKGKP